MKTDSNMGDFLEIIIALLASVVTVIYSTASTDEKIILISLFALFTIIAIYIKFISNNERGSSNRLIVLLRPYGSLWLLVLLISIINFLRIKSLILGIDSDSALLLIFVIAIIGYLRDVRSRKKYESIGKTHRTQDGIPSFFDLKNSRITDVDSKISNSRDKK